MVRFGAVRHDPDPLLAADVPGIDPHLGNAVLHGPDSQPVIKVDVRHQRHRTPVHQVAHRLRAGRIIDAHPDQVASRLRQRPDLRQRCFHIPCIRIGHALHQDRVSPAQAELSDFDFPGHLFSLPIVSASECP